VSAPYPPPRGNGSRITDEESECDTPWRAWQAAPFASSGVLFYYPFPMEAATHPRALTYARFVKVEHTIFSLPLLFAGAWLAADGYPGTRAVVLMVLAGFGARIVALALNRILDRHIDVKNPRTAGRELARGAMSTREAWLVTSVGLVVYLVSAGLLSFTCLLLSPIPLAVFVFYPLMKRFTLLAHLGVGLGLAMAPLGAWMAVRQTFAGSGPAILLGLFTIFWVAGFDIIYSTMDVEFDRTWGLHSMPSRLGVEKALRISGLFHVLAFSALLALFLWQFRTPLAGAGLLVTGLLLFLEHRQGHDVETAFFRINAILGFAVLAMVLAGVAAGSGPS
jgi:4-hydroxybenzoate polyprenyltransferase